MPEAQAWGFIALLTQVYATSQPYHRQEMSLVDSGPHGPWKQFFNFTCQVFCEYGAVMGLYLVNRLVQASGGHIEVDSSVGVGATFRVYLSQLSPPQLPA